MTPTMQPFNQVQWNHDLQTLAAYGIALFLLACLLSYAPSIVRAHRRGMARVRRMDAKYGPKHAVKK